MRGFGRPPEPCIDRLKRLVIHAIQHPGGKRVVMPRAAVVVDALERWLTAAPSAPHRQAVPLPRVALIQLPEVGLVQICLESDERSEPHATLSESLASAPAVAAPAVVTLPRSRSIPSWLFADWLRASGASVVVGSPKQLIMGQLFATEVQRLPHDELYLQGGRSGPRPHRLGGRSHDVANAVSHLQAALQCLETRSITGALMGMVMVGRRGCGKSSMAEVVGQTLGLHRSGHMHSRRDVHPSDGSLCGASDTVAFCDKAVAPQVWVGPVKAESLLGSQPAVALTRLRAALRRASACAPSLLILDDLHLAFPRAPAVAGAAGAPALAEAAAEMLSSLSYDCRRPPVAILATATSMEDLHPALQAAGLFDTALQLTVPDSRTRRRMLRVLTERRGLRCCRSLLQTAASLTEGLVAADLAHLIEGATLSAAARKLLPGSGSLTGQRAASSFTSACLGQSAHGVAAQVDLCTCTSAPPVVNFCGVAPVVSLS